MAPDSSPTVLPSARAGPRDPRSQAMAASLAVAVLMLVGKLGAYAATGSAAIFSDALESVVHLLATGIAAFSLWYAAQPPDAQHPYGHGKIAYFSSGFEGALILVAAVAIVVTGADALVTGPELERLGIGLAVTAALGLVNLMLGLWLVRTGRRHNAVVLVANGQHVLTDMWTSLGVLVGVGLVWLTGVTWIDPVVAILLGLNLGWTAVALLREAYQGLMESADPGETARLRSVLDRAETESHILGYHFLRYRRVNDRVYVEVHLLFPGDLPIEDAHAHATQVEEAIRAVFPKDHVEVTTHLEPEDHHHPDDDVHDHLGDALADVDTQG
ncbi:MAG: cation diffusion facilitator family transporter [Bacteroidota bacterium]